MPSPEYGQLARYLSTRFVHVISEAFIYALFITSLCIIHLNESVRNMNAARRDRMTIASALICIERESRGETCMIPRNNERSGDSPDSDEPLNTHDANARDRG